MPAPPGEPAAPRRSNRRGVVVGIVAAAGLVAVGVALGAQLGDRSTADPNTEPAAETAASESAPRNQEGDRGDTASSDPGDVMPDVVCMNLQDAQDAIQRAGVFFSRSHDATGQGRHQFLDSNWQVVAQTPEPGTPIGEFEPVLDVVKYGEQSPC
jgi:hypothetical protein